MTIFESITKWNQNAEFLAHVRSDFSGIEIPDLDKIIESKHKESKKLFTEILTTYVTILRTKRDMQYAKALEKIVHQALGIDPRKDADGEVDQELWRNTLHKYYASYKQVSSLALAYSETFCKTSGLGLDKAKAINDVCCKKWDEAEVAKDKLTGIFIQALEAGYLDDPLMSEIGTACLIR